MSFLLTSVAIIVLIVSGIGIMNVMFVTVAERTKEIGIMKAIGAQKHDILMQFLMEATVLSMIAGIIGVGLGYTILPFLDDNGAVISPEGGLLGFCFSVVVGIIFGFVPALQASKLDPVDALRSE
jgi:putative ABC transport system permease protein